MTGKNTPAALGAAILTMLVAGCGDGGVNSTPAPPAYKTLDQLTGNQTFQTGGTHYQNPGTGLTGLGTDAFGHGLVIDYNDAAGTFTLTAPDGTNGTFTQADFVATQSTATTRVFQKSTPTGGQSLSLSRPLVGGVQLSYLEIGSFTDVNAGRVKGWSAVGGVPTIASDLPKTGTATYTTGVGGVVINGSGVNPTDPAANSGTFSANFATGAITTSVHLVGAATSPGGVVDYGAFNGTGTIASGSPGFTGSFTGTTGAGFSGAFFGPQAAEMGYTFNFVAGANTVFGAAYGRKN
jgi:hypothetical protein